MYRVSAKVVSQVMQSGCNLPDKMSGKLQILHQTFAVFAGLESNYVQSTLTFSPDIFVMLQTLFFFA